jgi:hypothetical protein
MLVAVGAGALVGLSALPGLGATVPPGGAALTRVYDPATGATTFTVDVDRAGHAALSLVTCPGAKVLQVDGPGTAATLPLPGGDTIAFPSGVAGTYRVVLAGDTPGLTVGRKPSTCGDATLLIDPAVVQRAAAELGPSTRMTTLP